MKVKEKGDFVHPSLLIGRSRVAPPTYAISNGGSFPKHSFTAGDTAQPLNTKGGSHLGSQQGRSARWQTASHESCPGFSSS
jgi:hypothetical protein